MAFKGQILPSILGTNYQEIRYMGTKYQGYKDEYLTDATELSSSIEVSCISQILVWKCSLSSCFFELGFLLLHSNFRFEFCQRCFSKCLWVQSTPYGLLMCFYSRVAPRGILAFGIGGGGFMCGTNMDINLFLLWVAMSIGLALSGLCACVGLEGGRGVACGLCAKARTWRTHVSPSQLYPAGKVQWHFTCGFDFRHVSMTSLSIIVLQSWRG